MVKREQQTRKKIKKIKFFSKVKISASDSKVTGGESPRKTNGR